MPNPGLPMMGSASYVVRGVKKADIHGDVYYDTALSPRDEPGKDPVALRLPSHLILDPPAPGGSAADRLRAPLHGPSRHLVGRDAGLGVSGGTRVGGTGGDVRARRGLKTAFLLLHRSF